MEELLAAIQWLDVTKHATNLAEIRIASSARL